MLVRLYVYVARWKNLWKQKYSWLRFLQVGLGVIAKKESKTI